MSFAGNSESDLIVALQLKDFASIIRCCNLKAQSFNDGARLAHLLRIRPGKLAASYP